MWFVGNSKSIIFIGETAITFGCDCQYESWSGRYI